MLWFVKGWIAEQKGHPVNWVVVVVVITKEKVQHMGIIKPKLERSDVNEGSLQSFDGLSIVGNIVEKEEKDVNMLFMRKPTSDEKVGKVKKNVDMKCEVLKLTRVHMKQLEGKRKGLQDHLLCLKFNMEDQKLACVEVEKRVQNVEASF
jgi:hypothetical protein